MEGTSAEVVANYHRWVYFKKKVADGEFEIFSDINSKIKHYKRIRGFLLILILLNLVPGVVNYLNGIMQASIGIFNLSSYIAIISFSVVVLLLIFLVIPLSKKITFLEKKKLVRE